MSTKILDKVKSNHHEFLDFLKNYKVVELAIGGVCRNQKDFKD